MINIKKNNKKTQIIRNIHLKSESAISKIKNPQTFCNINTKNEMLETKKIYNIQLKIPLNAFLLDIQADEKYLDVDWLIIINNLFDSASQFDFENPSVEIISNGLLYHVKIKEDDTASKTIIEDALKTCYLISEYLIFIKKNIKLFGCLPSIVVFLLFVNSTVKETSCRIHLLSKQALIKKFINGGSYYDIYKNITIEITKK